MAKTEDTAYEVEISDAILHICNVHLNPGVIVGHSEILKKSPALYPYQRSDVKTFNIHPGSFQYEIENIYQGQIPSKIVVGLVSEKAYSGAYTKNPYNFEHFNCNFAGFFVDGQSVPGDPITCDYKNDIYVGAYLSLFSSFGNNGSGEGNYITREDFKTGSALYCFQVDGNTENETPSMSLL